MPKPIKVWWPERGSVRGAVPDWGRAGSAAALAAGLSDPTRVRLAAALQEVPRAAVNDLVDLVERERSVVSRHLLRMERAGITESSREGKYSLHSLTVRGRELLAVLLPEQKRSV